MIGQLVPKKQGLFRLLQILPAAFLGLLSAIIAVKFVNSFASITTAYLLIGILGILVFGPILYRIARHSLDIAEPGIWFAVYYFTHFGVRAIYDIVFGSLVLGFGPESVNFDLVNTALGVSIIGFLAFWTGYHMFVGKAFANSLAVLPRNWSLNRALCAAIFCVVLGWSFRAFLVYYQAGGIGAWLKANKYIVLAQAQGTMYLSILSSLSTVGWLIFFILARVFKKRKYRFLFTLFFVPDLAFQFASGSRAQFIFLLLMLLIALYMTSKRNYKTNIRYTCGAAVLITLFIFLFPFFSLIRGGIRNLEEIFVQTLNFWQSSKELFYLIGSRQVGLDSLAIVVDCVPKEEPYTLGSELTLVGIAWIPRKIWPDKPVVSLGKIFYERFYPPIFHEGTSVAITLPGEFYWAFGLIGVIIGMLVIGILWRLLFEYLVRPKGNLSNILVTSFMFPSFFVLAEQTLVSLLTMHLLQFIMIVIITLAIHRRTVEKGVA